MIHCSNLNSITTQSTKLSDKYRQTSFKSVIIWFFLNLTPDQLKVPTWVLIGWIKLTYKLHYPGLYQNKWGHVRPIKK